MSAARQNDQRSGSPLASAEAFGQLYEGTHLLVFRYIFGLHGGPKETVEDLTAETFMRAWNARRRFGGSRDAAVGWLLRIARNLVIDAIRKEKFRGVPLDLDSMIVADPGQPPEAMALLHEQFSELWQAMQALPAERREMLVLRYMLGWRVNEIAQHLEMAENTVSQTIRRTLQKIQADLEDAA